MSADQFEPTDQMVIDALNATDPSWDDEFSRAKSRSNQRNYMRKLLRVAVPAALKSFKPEPTSSPVPQCEFTIGQAVRLARTYAEDDPTTVYYITEIRWEYRLVPSNGWSITIATKSDIELGYGATTDFAPDDLVAV